MRSCDWGDRIESAALREVLDDDERAHLRGCAECRKLTGVVRALLEQGRAAERRGARHIPSARQVLLRARQLREQRVQGRVLRPIVWVERCAGLVGLVTVLSTAAWLARRWTELVGPAVGSRFGPAAAPDPTTVAMIVAGAMLLGATLVGVAALGGPVPRSARR